MQRRRTTSPPIMATVLAVMVMLCTTMLAAQDTPKAAAQHAEAPDEELIDVQFPGGTVAEYIAALRKAHAEANIVSIPPASEALLPKIELRHSSVNSAAYLLHELVAQHSRGLAELRVASVPTMYSGESEIYTITARVYGPENSPAAGTINAAVETRVWSIADLLDDHLKAEQVLSAIEAGLDLIKEEHEPAEIRYHADTALIIASGHPAQIAMIHEITHSLWDTRLRQQERERSLQPMKDIVAQVEMANQRLAEENMKLRQERDELLQTNQNFEAQIGNLRDRLAQADHELSQLKSQRERQP